MQRGSVLRPVDQIRLVRREAEAGQSVGAHLPLANLSDARLAGADLSSANLSGAHPLGAQSTDPNLFRANLAGTTVAAAELAATNLTNGIYAPASAPPAPTVFAIQGLSTVRFPAGTETGLIQLRDLLQKAGLRDLEREATLAI